MSGVVVLSGGVGGAKLVDGLYRSVPRGTLTAIVNTGDDFTHLGLAVSPYIDSVLYLLSGQSNEQLGWGREGETWNFMAALKRLGGPGWFNLGDGDLALHVLRALALQSGETLSSITQRFAEAWSLELKVCPMSDSPVATWLDTDRGRLPFQEYFVGKQCRPIVSAFTYEGSEKAQAPADAIEAIAAASAIILAPSNPWLSIDPILAVPAIRQALARRSAPLVAISPLVKGTAVKGPTAKLMSELGLEISNQTIAEHYAGLIDGLLIHEHDDVPIGLHVDMTDTLMRTPGDRCRVARTALEFISRLRR
jgi:LPPG:FO 2-phospho-L-lactate transferase